MNLTNARELRKNATDCERLLWLHLRAHRLQGFKFKRQQPIGPYIVDFVCFETRCIVEADGGHHAEQIEYDTQRDDWLRSQGFNVLRFWNNDILANTEGVLERILAACGAPSPQPLPRRGGGANARGSLPNLAENLSASDTAKNIGLTTEPEQSTKSSPLPSRERGRRPMSFPRYESYKDSGVEWLGEVPEHWDVKRLKFLCNVQTGDKDAVNAIENGQYPFFVRSQTVERIDSFTFDCEAVLTAGDGVGVGKVFHYIDGKFDFHQRVYMMNNFQFVTGLFFFWYLSATFYKVALEGGAKSTVDSLRMPLFMNFTFAVPPEQEQKEIIAFLDHETVKIDALIAEQQRLIELLKEKRQAVISHAVTKGLNPNAPIKDSGIEWLGEVPEHWEVCALKRMTKKITDGAHISPETENGVYEFISTKDVRDDGIDFENCLRTSEASYEYLVRTGCKPSPGDVLFSKDGTIGRTVVVRENRDFVVASSLIIIKPDNEAITPDFLNYLCQSSVIVGQVESFVKGAGLPRLSIQNLLKIVGVFPSVAEQKVIVDHLNLVLGQMTSLLSSALEAITLLQERRTALISAAVTGKIDVRNFQPHEDSFPASDEDALALVETREDMAAGRFIQESPEDHLKRLDSL